MMCNVLLIWRRWPERSSVGQSEARRRPVGRRHAARITVAVASPAGARADGSTLLLAAGAGVALEEGAARVALV